MTANGKETKFWKRPLVYVFDLDETILYSTNLLKENGNLLNSKVYKNFEIAPIVEILGILSTRRLQKPESVILLLLTNNRDMNYIFNVDQYFLDKFTKNGKSPASAYASSVPSLQKFQKPFFFFDNIHWLGYQKTDPNKTLLDVAVMLKEIGYPPKNQFETPLLNSKTPLTLSSNIKKTLSDIVYFFDDNPDHQLHKEINEKNDFLINSAFLKGKSLENLKSAFPEFKVPEVKNSKVRNTTRSKSQLTKVSRRNRRKSRRNKNWRR